MVEMVENKGEQQQEALEELLPLTYCDTTVYDFLDSQVQFNFGRISEDHPFQLFFSFRPPSFSQ